jgi:predicted transcriptional regulator
MEYGIDYMGTTKYRTSNLIIQDILESILRVERENLHIKKGIIKSHLIKYTALKTATAEKYLQKMEKAGYIISQAESWGERKITVYHTTPIGRERYQWFVKINAEIE